MDRKWLRSQDGQAFVRAVAAQLKSTSGARAAIAAGATQTGDPAADWEMVKDDFIQGVELAYGQLTTALEQEFRARLDDHYQQRFLDGYETIADFSLLIAQAIVLGGLTVNMLKLHKGEVGQYPKTNANATLSPYYLEWARDYVGFFTMGYVRWSHEAPPRVRRANVTPVDIAIEFEKGCSLC